MKKPILLSTILILTLFTGCGQTRIKTTEATTETTTAAEEVSTEKMEEIIASGSGQDNTTPEINTEDTTEDTTEVEYTGAESKILTEKEAKDLLTARNFTDTATYDYSESGEYIGDTDISDSDDKHPMYNLSYISSNDELWTIMIVNDSLVAYPVSYNIESDRNVETIIAESDTITTYYSDTNTFVTSQPTDDVLHVVVVDNIDANTIDQLTIDVLKDM